MLTVMMATVRAAPSPLHTKAVANTLLNGFCRAEGEWYLQQQVIICVVFNEADMTDSCGWVGPLSLDACRKLLHACFKGLPLPLLISRLQGTAVMLTQKTQGN